MGANRRYVQGQISNRVIGSDEGSGTIWKLISPHGGSPRPSPGPPPLASQPAASKHRVISVGSLWAAPVTSRPVDQRASCHFLLRPRDMSPTVSAAAICLHKPPRPLLSRRAGLCSSFGHKTSGDIHLSLFFSIYCFCQKTITLVCTLLRAGQ